MTKELSAAEKRAEYAKGFLWGSDLPKPFAPVIFHEIELRNYVDAQEGIRVHHLARLSLPDLLDLNMQEVEAKQIEYFLGKAGLSLAKPNVIVLETPPAASVYTPEPMAESAHAI